MEKILQRAKYAQKQALKRLQKRKAYIEDTEAWQRQRNTERVARVFNQNLVEARQRRNVDWQTGALAPRRDIGDRKSGYGALSIYDFNLPELDKDQVPDFLPFTEGDRVVVVKGREAGRIGEIADVQRDRNGVRVNGLNVVDVEVPQWMNEAGGKIQAIPRHFSMSDVRLVYPLPDPVTGIPRDVVIERLEGFRRPRNKRLAKGVEDGHKYERYIPGTNTVIPWPVAAETEEQSYDADTAIISVEETSFRPYLLAAPMPVSVIDELRGKYSKHRTRHDADYVEQKEAEVARMGRRKGLGKTMRTPLQELAEVRAKQKKAAERELSDAQLAKIGEVIEREQTKAVDGVARSAEVTIEQKGAPVQ